MHGWAGAASHWTPWRAATAERPWTWCCGERGYGGGETFTPSWGTEGRRVVLAHSLGPHLLAAELLAAAEAVVLLASFGRFVPPGRAGRRVRTGLAGMAAALADGPDEPTAASRAQAMLAAFLARVKDCDGLALLPGWVRSEGVRAEVDEAARRGKPWITVEAWIGMANRKGG
jgi:pimeloyl-[acyl-carrier protein] methyl ester esterase